MKRKKINRIDINSLKIKRKKINFKEISRLIKKIGAPFEEGSAEYGKYSPA